MIRISCSLRELRTVQQHRLRQASQKLGVRRGMYGSAQTATHPFGGGDCALSPQPETMRVAPVSSGISESSVALGWITRPHLVTTTLAALDRDFERLPDRRVNVKMDDERFHLIDRAGDAVIEHLLNDEDFLSDIETLDLRDEQLYDLALEEVISVADRLPPQFKISHRSSQP